MIILLLLSFSIVIASGYLFVKVFWFDRQQIFLPLSLGFGYGLGLLSILHFVLLLLNKYHRTWVIGSELLLLSLLFAFYQYRSKKRKPYELYVMNKTAKEKPYWGLFFCLCVNLIVVFGILWLLVLQNPYGQFDAWAIWNFRARFLFLSGGNWQVVFTIVNDWQHTDYPLLLPLNVARLWFFFAEENSIGPILLSVTFFTATLGIMFTALRQIRSMFHAIIAVFLLLATPFFIWQGAAQYADIPLGFYFLLVVVLLAFYDLIGTWQLLFLAGMAAGFAAWTKNEGLLFVLVFFLAHGLLHVVSKHRQQQSYWWELKALGLGLMPVLLMLLFFKYYLAAPNDVVNQESDIVPKLLNAARYSVTGQMFLQIGLNVANIPLLVLPVYLFLMGVDKAKLKRPFLPIICLTFLLLMVGYFMIYIVTPYDLTWHLLSSLQRLYLQIWPSLIFITIFVSAYPQTTTKREGEKPA